MARNSMHSSIRETSFDVQHFARSELSRLSGDGVGSLNPLQLREKVGDTRREVPTASPVPSDESSRNSSLLGKDEAAGGKRHAPERSNSVGIREQWERHPFPVVPSEKTDEALERQDYPEGGLQAWLVVVGSWCAMFACFGFMNIGGVYQSYISTHQLAGYSESSIGWIFSTYIFLSFFCGIQIGPFFDTKGPRILIAAGTVCLLLGIFTLAESTELWHFFLTYSVLSGIGTSLLFTPSIACIAHYFNRRRGLTTGLACTAGSIGGTLFPLIMPPMFERIGFAWTTRVVGLICLLTLLLANVLLRARLPPKPSPRLRDFLPDLRILLEGRGEMAACTAGIFCIEWGLFVPFTYVVSWALRTGVGGDDPTFAYQLLSIISAASFFGRWLPGFLADRIGPFNTILLAAATCLVGIFGFWLPGTLPPHGDGDGDGDSDAAGARGSVPLAVVFCLLFGFGSGSGVSLTPVCVGRLCAVEHYGRYYATAYTFVSVGCLTGVPIAGALIQLDAGEYTYASIFSGLCYVASIVFFAIARHLLVGRRLAVFC